MATVQRIFDTLDTSSFLDGGSAASVTITGQASELIDLSQWEGCHCFVEAQFIQAPTDDLVIKVESSNDGGINFDTVPLFSFTVSKSDSALIKTSFIVTSVYGFRVDFAASSTNDSINVFFHYRRWRWETA